MATTSPKHVVVNCLLKEVEDTLGAYDDEYELIGMTSCQVGTGFGAHVEVILAFRLYEPAELEAGSGLPPGRQRRSPFQALNGQKKTLDRPTATRARA